MSEQFHAGNLAKRSRSGVGWKDVREAHELDEVEQGGRCILESYATAAPTRRELKACQRVDADRIRLHACNVATSDRGRLVENRAHALAEPGQVGAGDRAADGEG